MTTAPHAGPVSAPARAMPVARLTRAQQRVRAAGLSDLLRVLAAEVRELCGADLVSVATSDDGRYLVSREMCGRPWSGGPIAGDAVPVEGTLAGLALTTGTSQVCVDALDDPRSDRRRNVRFAIGSSMAVPVTRDGQVVGVVSALARDRARFDAEDLAAVELTCDTASDRLTQLVAVDGDAELHRTVLDALDEAVVVTRGADLELLHANHALRRMSVSGRVPEVGTRLRSVPWRLFGTDGQPIAADDQPTARAWRTGEGVRDVVMRLEGEGGPGADRWVCVTALPVRDPLTHQVLSVVTRMRDVTAERAQTAALVSRDERFRLAFDSSPIGMGLIRLEPGAEPALQRANAALVALLGHPDEADLIAREASWSAPELVARDRAHLARLLHGELDSLQMETRCARADGSTFPALVTASVSRLGSGSSLLLHVLDLTERERVAQETALSERLFRAAFEHAPSGMVVVSAREEDRGVIVRANDAICELLGVPAEDVVGRVAQEFLVEADRDPSHATLARVAATGNDSGTSHRRVQRPDGTVRDVYVSSTALSRDTREPTVLTHVVDVTQQQAHQRTLETMATTDSMTGLANRVRLAGWIDDALAGPADRVALLMLDLDRFKNVNDSLGHDVGDQLLVQVARRLAAGGDGWKVARLGGDEFVVLLTDVHGVDQPARVAQEVLDAVARPYLLGSGHRIETTGSVGIALGGRLGQGGANLLRQADLALYAAKDAGRNRFAVCDGELLEAMENRVRTEQMLRRGLDAGRLRVHLQPIVGLGDRGLVALEALVRLDDPVEGLLLPYRFIGVAEESGLITEVDRAVLAEAVRIVAQHPRLRDPAIRVAVNLSSRTLAQPDLARYLGDLLTAHGVSGTRLLLEVTETGLLADDAELHRTLGDLVALGAHLAIDDFGTGYSALAYLTRFRMHKLKIDRAFVRELDDGDGVAAATVRAIIQLAHAHGMRVTAEGVETEQQAELLTGMGCDSAQGWLFGRPADAWG